jgi:recombination protein RecA
MYGHGISREGDLLDLGAEMGVVDKRGSYYSFEETRMGQGRENVREFLRQNPDIALQIENQVRAKAGVQPAPTVEGIPGDMEDIEDGADVGIESSELPQIVEEA